MTDISVWLNLQRMQNLRVNCANCLLIKYNIWICLKKKTFWLMPFCPHFQPCYWAPKELQPLQSTGERLEGESKGEVSEFLLLCLSSAVSFCSDYFPSTALWETVPPSVTHLPWAKPHPNWTSGYHRMVLASRIWKKYTPRPSMVATSSYC